MTKKNRNNRLNRKRKPRFLTAKNPAPLLGGLWQGSLGDGIRITFSVTESAEIDALLDFMLNHSESGSYE